MTGKRSGRAAAPETPPMFVLADGSLVRPEVAGGIGGLKDTDIIPALATWTSYRGSHKPCDACGQRVHKLGPSKAPRPQPATHTRKGPNTTLYLCNEDAQLLRDEDVRVARERDGRIAHAQHLKRSR